MSKKHQIPGNLLIQIILECRDSFSILSDPLIPHYVRACVTSSLSQASDVLYVLIRNWNSREPEKGLAAELKKPGCLSSPDSVIINDLAVAIASNKAPWNTCEARRSLSMVSRWLVALIGWISQDGENRSYLAVLTLLEALGILFASIISTEQGLLLLGSQEDLGKSGTADGSVSSGEAHVSPFRSQVPSYRRFGGSASAFDQHIGTTPYPSRYASKTFPPLSNGHNQRCPSLDAKLAISA